DSEVLISLTPHILRAPKVTDEDLEPLFVGTEEVPRVPGARPPLFGPEEPAPPKPETPPGTPPGAGAAAPAGPTAQPGAPQRPSPRRAGRRAAGRPGRGPGAGARPAGYSPARRHPRGVDGRAGSWSGSGGSTGAARARHAGSTCAGRRPESGGSQPPRERAPQP